MTQHPASILPDVIDAALTAGQMVAKEFSRPTGPRLIDHVTAPIDHEVELYLRERLMGLVPARFVGEEAGVVAAEANGLCWVVDPHDGTRAYLEGKRGSAVSIALLRQGQPILAVVYAPLSPDRGPDMIAWAEGEPITRNGAVVTIDLTERDLTARDVVFLNHGVWQRPLWNTIACAPARFMPLPSIAYRLARIAVGDGIATQTLRPVNALDIAAGHALLLAAGGVLVAEDGQPVTYNELGESRPSACFGGAPLAVRTLLTRTWRGSTEDRREPRVTLDWPRAPETHGLDRAIGCLLGLAIGDALGTRFERQSAAEITLACPDGPRDIPPGTQGTDDTELTLTLARALVGRDCYDADATALAYGAWLASGTRHAGRTTARAFAAATPLTVEAARQAADPDSQGNGSLMRVAPIGLWSANPAQVARTDSALSHPHPACQAACAALTAAIAAAIDGADRANMLAAARTAAPTDIGGALEGQVDLDSPVLTALGLAFRHLNAGSDLETALIQVVREGGDTDTNAAITGALIGAADGRRAIPARWVMHILTSRPGSAATDDPAAGLARPDIYWTDDLIDLAEALLTRRETT